MDFQPRDAIFNVIRAFANHVKAVREAGGNGFGDQRNEPNSVVDAEMLLTLLMPHAEIKDVFSLDHPAKANVGLAKILNEMVDQKPPSDEVLLHDKTRETILNLLLSFFTTYQDNNKPQFRIGSYGGFKFKYNEGPEIVDSYALSLTLCIHVLKLLAAWNDRADRRLVGRMEEWDRLESLASQRLTESMYGLLSSFTVSRRSVQNWSENTGRTWPEKDKVADLRDRLHKIGVLQTTDNDAFECGWTWAPIAPEQIIIPLSNAGRWKERIRSVEKSAIAEPYLYFTVTALDSIADLSGPDVLSSGLLDEEQLAIADRLRIFADVTSSYWEMLAFGDDYWPIEYIPWYTTDKKASDYWTLYVLRIVQDKLPVGDASIGRIIDLLGELGQRARITRQPFPADTDPAVSDIHTIGFQLQLEYSDQKDPFIYPVYDFAPQLLKQSAQLLGLPSLNDNHRTQLLRLIQAIWKHLERRSVGSAWDYPENVFHEKWFENITKQDANIHLQVRSWYFSERVTESLIALAKGENARPKSSDQLKSIAAAILTEAEWRARKEFQSDDLRYFLDRLSVARNLLDDDPLLALSIAVTVGDKRLDKIIARNK